MISMQLCIAYFDSITGNAQNSTDPVAYFSPKEIMYSLLVFIEHIYQTRLIHVTGTNGKHTSQAHPTWHNNNSCDFNFNCYFSGQNHDTTQCYLRSRIIACILWQRFETITCLSRIEC